MMAMMMESGDKPEVVPKTLTWVCLLGHLSTLDWLLAESKWETNPFVNGETVVSCLRIAALDQNVIGIVNRLLSTFRDHFEWEINGSCDLLSFAAKNGHAELLSELLHHPRVNSYIINVSVIHGAIANNDLEIVKLCLQDPRLGTGFNISSCIQYAVELKNAEILDYLLRRQQPGVSPSYDGNMALRTACKRGSLEIVVLLLAHPKLAVLTSDVIVEAIGYAVQAENPKIVELILSDPRCDPTTFLDFYNVFVDACSRGCVDIVRLFLNDARISFDEFRFRPILAAIRSGNAALVHLLVEDGRLEVGGKENLPLKEAFYGGQKEMVRILINSGRVNPSVIGQ
ncbi:ankyrin repeat-containing domain protein [Obelidium mucronatum]|nr:ankyrin repeat-containing domain protein [Obelidium mucronatum]